tara:strand:- start:3498 stop:4148 length:651 start_codon:yes stop_codon:yes gene_type:complete
MKKSLTIALVLVLSVACAVIIAIGMIGTPRKQTPEIAEPISTRIIAPAGGANSNTVANQTVVMDGPSQKLSNAAVGKVTWLPAAGDLIEFGTALYAIDDKPVILLKGSLPMHRTIRYKIADGPDVAQLERNLVDLGYAVDEAVSGLATDLTIDHHVTPLTVSSIRAWQLSLGITSTGVVDQGDIIFRPEPVQISSVHSELGDNIDGESIVSVLVEP